METIAFNHRANNRDKEEVSVPITVFALKPPDYLSFCLVRDVVHLGLQNFPELQKILEVGNPEFDVIFIAPNYDPNQMMHSARRNLLQDKPIFPEKPNYQPRDGKQHNAGL